MAASSTPGIRLTMFFSTDNYTWTESLYGPASDYVTYIDLNGNPSALLHDLLVARAAMLAEGANMQAARLSDPTNPKTSQYVSPQAIPNTTPFSSGGGQTNADRPYSTVIVQATGEDNQVSRLYFSGAPDEDIGEGTNFHRGWSPVSGWITKLNQYRSVLTVQGWKFRSISYAGSQQVQGLVSTGPANAPLGITVLNAFTFSRQPPALSFKGFRRSNPRSPGVHGQFKLALPLPTAAIGGVWTYYLIGGSPAAVSNVTTLGLAAALGYVYPKINTMIVQGATHHKRGASALAPRGRSRTRV